MGHQISKQQNQQMSDDQQMTSSIETHIDPSTSATTDLQVKISKNTRLFTSNAKKLRKQQQQQQQQPNQRSDVSSSKIKTKAKAKVKPTIHTRSTANNTVVSETEAATATALNQERNAGSVVITIRLLKMESSRGFEMNSVGNELTQIDNYSNNNNNSSSSSSTSSNDSKNNNNNNNNSNSNDDSNRLRNQLQASDAHSLHCNVYMPENSTQNQNNSFKMDNNNVNVRRFEAEVLTVTSGGTTPNNANNGQNSVKKSSHVNHRALRSEAIICDNVPINCTSQTEQQQQLQQSATAAAAAAVSRNCLAHSFNEIRLAEPITASPATVTTNINLPRPSTVKSIQTTTSTKTPSAFIPSNLIGTVSPYPHHIPIANIIRSDCFNGLVDTEHSALCQHAKKVCSSCGVNGGSGGGGGGAANIVTKQNGASKESKELKSKKPNWGIKLNCTKLRGIKSLSSSLSSEPSSPSAPANPTTAVNDSDNTNTNAESNVIANNATTITATVPAQQPTALLCTSGGNVIIVTTDQQQPWFASDEYSIEDCDKKAHLQRAIEIAENVEPTPPGFISSSDLHQSLHSMSSSNLQLLPGTMASAGGDANGRNAAVPKTPVSSQHWTMVCSNSPALRIMLPSLLQHAEDMSRIHSQVDYIHCLVPDLMQITNCSFYWGKMDRYEAERLLDNKPEGTFLLRDSAQEEFLFSVSFRKYGRSLHARIEQFNHKFSFDCHDSSVYTSKTVTGLLEHYKDPGCVMFFEPALTIPLNRNFVFSLQQLCRATIVSHTTYDGINEICLPKKLKSYLKEYHYKQHVRVKRFDEPIYGTS